MGKPLRDEDLRLNIIVNGDAGRKAIDDLKRSVSDSKTRIDMLIAQQKELERQGKQLSPEYKQLTAEINRKSTALDKETERLKTLIRQQSIEKMTLRELQQHYRTTTMAFRNADPGSEVWRKLRYELQQTDARIKELKGSAIASEGIIKRMAGGFSRFFGAFTAGFASLSFATLGVNKARTTFLEYDEALTNARKTTDETSVGIIEVSNDLKKIDTRTAQNSLLDIVRVAGQLGIKGKENLIEFARAGDKIGVALGRDLGGNTEAAIKEIGKLVDIFHLEEEFGIERSMLKVGSAINELGMASTASEGYIVEFAKRTAGAAPNVDISIQSVLSLGATLDKLGQQAETAGTAYGQVIFAMYKRTEVFAKIAKMSLGDFRKLMNEDMNEAFIRVLEGMGKSGNGMQAIVNALTSMKLDGQRSVQVLGVLAANTDVLRRQQDIANKSFEEGTSIQKEFAVQNESATARYEKQKKALTDQARTLGEVLNPAFEASASTSVVLLKALTMLVGWLYQTKGAIIGLAAVYVGYIALQKIDIAYKKLQSFWSNAHRVALMQEATALESATAGTMLMSAAQNLLVGNFRAAGIAAKAFFASLGPIGWLTIAIGALATAWSIVADKTSAADKFQKILSDHMRAAATDAAIERKELDRLKGKLEACKIGTKEYNDTKQEIINKFGKYDSTLKDETITVETLKGKYDSLTAAILQSAKTRQYNKYIEAQQTSFDEQFGEISEVLWKELNEDYYVEKASKYYNQIMNAFLGGQSLDAWLTTGSSKSKALVRDLNELRDAQNKAEKEAKNRFGITDSTSKPLATPPPEDDPNPLATTSSDDGKKWSLEKDKNFLAAKAKLQKQYLDGGISSEAEFNDELLKAEIKALKDRLALQVEEGAARLNLENQLGDKLLEQKKTERSRQEEADRLLADAETDLIKRENDRYELQKKKFAGNAAALEALEKAHQRNITKIHLDQLDERLKRDQEQFDLDMKLLKNRHRQELLDFQGNATERKQLKKEQLAEEAQLEVDHATRLAQQLQSLLNSGIFDGIQIDMNLLSDEEKQKLQNQIADFQTQLLALRTSVSPKDYSFGNQKSDILGFSTEDWKLFFENLEAGKFGADEMAMALQAAAEGASMAMNLYSSYDKMMTAKENAEFKRYQKLQEKKKKVMQSRVKAGLMTEEQSSAEEERIQAETDAKQEELEIKQAKRQKTMSIAEAIINTAVSVAAALKAGPIAGPIMAAIIGAMGAAQIAMIASTPIAGAEEGGQVVERMQDGKKFKAKYAPDKRGFISSPTVLVSEDGKEYVVPSDAMENPSLIPILNTIEAARRQGTLKSFDFNAVYRQQPKAPGFTAGGLTGDVPTFETTTSSSAGDIDSTQTNLLLEAVNKLIKKLDDPIPSYVTLLGENGLVRKMKELEKNREHGKLG